MDDMMERSWWSRAPQITRVSVGLAAFAALLNASSYFGLRLAGLGQVVYVVLLPMPPIAALMVLEWHTLWRNVVVGGSFPRVAGAGIPVWLALSLPASAAYLAVLIVGTILRGDGAPELRAGVEVLVSNGRVVGELPAGSVAAFEAQSLRLFSAAEMFMGTLLGVSHWLLQHAHRAAASGKPAARARLFPV